MGDIVAGLAAFLAAFVIERVERKRLWREAPRRDPAGHVELRASFLTVAGNGVVSASLTALGLTILALRGSQPLWGVLLGGTFFTLLGALGLWWSWAVGASRTVVRPEGIEVVRGQRRRLVPWAAVRAVDCNDVSPVWKWLTIRGDSEAVRVPLHARGARHLYRELRARVPEDRWDDTYPAFESEPGARLFGPDDRG